jgi:hypothetical protein
MTTPTVPAAPPTTTAPPTETPTTATPHIAHTKAGVSPTEAAQLAEWAKQDFQKGRITQAQLDEQFDALQTPPEQRAGDTRTPAVKELDHLDGPPAQAHEYVFDLRAPGQSELTPEQKVTAANARKALAAAGFSKAHGNALMTQILRVDRMTATMSPKELESYVLTENAKLDQRFGGPEATTKKLEAAAEMIGELEKHVPGLSQALRQRGIGDNALVVAGILQQYDRWKIRNGR